MYQGFGSLAMKHGTPLNYHITTLISSGTYNTARKLIQTPALTSSSRLFKNAERVRTCNSVVTKVPGMYASINNSTDPKTDEIIGYISPAGIPSIANQTDQELDVVTPYGVFPTVLFDKAVGLAWWRNMIVGKKMQSK